MLTWRHAIIALFVLTAAAVNVTKPIHIDDTAYLEISKAILHDPWHPLSQSINWGDTAAPIFEINQPLLMPYVFALVMKIWGESELALHLVTALSSALAISFFYLLVRRLRVESPLFLTGLFALGPAFLPAQNVMVDIPLMAMWLAFFWAILSVGRDDPRMYAVAACAVALACLTKYTSLVLLPILVFAIVFRRHSRSAWVLGIPAVALALWSWFNYADFGAIHLFGRPQQSLTAQIAAYRAIALIAGIGSISPFVASLVSLRRDGPAGRVELALAVMAGVAVGLLLLGTGATEFAGYWIAFFAAGVLVTAFVLSSLYRDASTAWRAQNRDDAGTTVVLALWIVGTVAFVVLFSPTIAIRHILLILPPILILLGRQVSRRGGLAARDAIGFALTVALGLWLAVSDYSFAGVYRRVAREIRGSVPTNARVYEAGHWGWQWYATRAGMIQYDMKNTRLQPGDYLVAPSNIHRQEFSREDASRLQVEHRLTIPAPRATRLRTMYTDGESGGYYAFTFPGVTPWRVSKAPFVFEIFRMTSR